MSYTFITVHIINELVVISVDVYEFNYNYGNYGIILTSYET